MIRLCRVTARILNPITAGWLSAASLGGQETVELPGEDRWLEADFEEVFRVGSPTGAEWEQFGDVRKVMFDGAGRLFVFDGQAERIFVVGTDGALVREIGRRGEGPGEFRDAADFVHRDDLVTAFRDIRPLAPTHILIVPNEAIPTLADVSAGHEPVLGRMLRVAADLAAREGIAQGGYRVMINCRDHGGQEVYHLHLHLLGGRPLGRMLGR